MNNGAAFWSLSYTLSANKLPACAALLTLPMSMSAASSSVSLHGTATAAATCSNITPKISMCCVGCCLAWNGQAQLAATCMQWLASGQCNVVELPTCGQAQHGRISSACCHIARVKHSALLPPIQPQRVLTCAACRPWWPPGPPASTTCMPPGCPRQRRAPRALTSPRL